jgi:tetratricopeptide (TPR) repeat protein
LTQLVSLAHDEKHYTERLHTIGGALDEGSEAHFSEDLAGEVVPSFESFAIVDETTAVDDDNSAAAPEFEWNSVADSNSTNISFADHNEVDEAEAAGDQSSVDRFSQDFTLAQPETPAAEAEAGNQTADVLTRNEEIIKNELESVDFYIAQGYTDIALDTLKILERQFGRNAEFDARRARLNPNAATVEFESASDVVPAAKPEPETVIVLSDASLVEEQVSQSIPNAAPSQTGIDSGLAEIFEEFRVEAEGEHATTTEDFETHYNMATAYKEMDLLDEAIREFQTAAGLTRPSDNTQRFFQCCNMLGHCFVQKGLPQAAVLWFKKGLDAPGRGAEEYKALQYELGSAYEQMGDLTRAVGALTEVYGLDVGYRDVSDRLQDLQARQRSQKKKKK